MSEVTGEAPRFRVVRGQPTEEELAALVAVLTALPDGSAAPPTPAAADSGWSAYWRSLRAPVEPGAQSWRMSARA